MIKFKICTSSKISSSSKFLQILKKFKNQILFKHHILFLGYNPQATTWSAWAVMPRPLRERFTWTSEWSLNGPSQFGPTGRLFSLFLFKQILDVHKYILNKKLKFQIGINFEFGTKKFKFGINFKLEQILDWNKF
jgi:hypothetical protein